MRSAKALISLHKMRRLDAGQCDKFQNSMCWLNHCVVYSKTCVKRPLSKRPKFGFQDQLSLNAGQKYCRMLQGEHSAILSTFINLPFVIFYLCFVYFLSGRFTQILLYLRTTNTSVYGIIVAPGDGRKMQ